MFDVFLSWFCLNYKLRLKMDEMELCFADYGITELQYEIKKIKASFDEKIFYI